MKQTEKMNDAVGTKNCFMTDEGGKRLVSPFTRQYFWKGSSCVLLEVIYGKKEHKLWSEITKASCRLEPTKIQRYVC